jgi:predicted ATPase/class 3 adenylate cyclase/DNA-binding XRE family transcriptional regulator
MDDSASFGYWVRRRRKALDLTQDALAQQVGCSVMTIRKIEGDIRRPSRQIAERLAEFLEIPVSERQSFVKAARAELRVDRLARPTADLTDHASFPGPVAPLEEHDPSVVVTGSQRPFTGPLPSGTVTFLFADLPASARLWERDHSAMEAALVRYHTLLRSAVETYDGVVFKTVGDLACAAFARAPTAIQAALTTQRALHTETWGDVGSLRTRIAIHSGSVEVHDSDYIGLPLSRVARLLEIEHAGQTLLSLATSQLIQDHLPPSAALRELGTHRLRDLTRPEHIFQIIIPDLPTEFPPLNSLAHRTTNLPVQPTPLIGREHEVATAQRLLRRADVRLVTFTGPGGVGKTRVALQVAAELLDDFVDGVWFIDLAPVSDPSFVIITILQALNVRESGEQSLLDRLKDDLRGKQVLLLLDNFEQVLEAALLVADLLAVAPQLTILVTSRETLHLRGETEFAVSPLALPDPKQLPSREALSQYAAVELFIQRAQDVQPDFAINNENALAVAEICYRLDGLPLAIELAAARIRLFAPAALLARLENRLLLLIGGPRDLPARQQTLRNTIAWSYNLLDEGEQTLFARLVVFVGGWTLDAAEAVCNPAGDLEIAILDGLQSLLDKSLVRQVEGPDGEPRFVMLETIREYALERFEQEGAAEVIRRHHAAFYLALVEHTEPELFGTAQAMWLKRLEIDYDNVRAVLRWSQMAGHDLEVGLRLVSALVLQL